jgi:uncharacterized protein YhbP (UPF0306 family)
MSDKVDRSWIKDLIQRNRYLVLSTTDGTEPWVATLAYVIDDDLNFYFFSPEGVRHVRHLEANDAVAVVVFDRDQPEYTPEMSANLNGIQVECTARRLTEDEYTDVVVAAIDELKLPMPPYAVFKIEPHRFYVPTIENGVDVRYEVDMG